MNSKRRCPVCRSSVSSDDSTHCPACGAILDYERGDADNAAVNNIINSVKQQISPLDDPFESNVSRSGSVDGKDVSGLLSEETFQSILDESLDDNTSFAPGSTQASSGKTAGEERAAPFGTVLESFKQSDAQSAMDKQQHDVPVSRPVASASDLSIADSDRPYIERPEPVRPPLMQKKAPKPRTWWTVTRQAMWLLLLLIVCIVFFRIFGPERKEPTIEDFFRPGNPDVEFLDAIEFLEKYYEKQRKEKAADFETEAADTSFEGMQQPEPSDATGSEPLGRVPENTTLNDSVSSDPQAPESAL